MREHLTECINNTYKNRIAPFLWLHGEEDSLILEELNKIYESGIRAVCLESRTHEDFCGNGWWEDIKIILNHCRKLGMKVWILDDKHFPSGYSNGIFEEKYKNLQSYDITERHVDVVGPLENASFFADAWKNNEDDEILAAVLCRRDKDSSFYTLEDATDISRLMKDGMLYADVPEGYWRIIFFIKTQVGRGNRFKIYSDKLNPQATDAIIEEIYESHFREIGEYFGNTFLGFFGDEPGFDNNRGKKAITPLGEMHSFYPWHDDLQSVLAEKFGDNVWERLVNLFFEVKRHCVESRGKYMDAITELYNKNYSGRLAEWCHNHNVMYIGHIIEDNNSAFKTGSTAGNYFRALEGQDMSGIDVVLGQLIPGMDDICHTYCAQSFEYADYRFFRYTLAKLASSMAHTNERMNGNAMCEIFGAYGWSEGTKIMKWLTDFMLVRGINYFVPHAFSPKKNDEDCPPNFYANGENPQFKYFKNIMTHMNRCAHMLTCGKPVVCCGVLYDTEVRWGGGKFLPCDNVAEVLLNNQIDFDYICHDYLLKSVASNGELKIGTSAYQILLVPYAEYMPQKTLSKLSELEAAGINILCLDKKPEFTTDGGNADVYLPKTEIIPLDSLTAYMQKHELCELRLIEENPKIKYCHRRKDNENLYFFVSEDINNDISQKIELKGFSGGDYIIYDPLTNEISRSFSSDGLIELKLHPYQSLMVITGVECKDIPVKKHRKKVIEKDFFDYSLSLAKTGEEFAKYKELSSPVNVTGANEAKDFSGYMKYEGTFTIDNQGDYEIDLGRVGEVAEVFVNGIKVGERICPPYSFNITKAIRPGINMLEINVANTLVFQKKDNFSRLFAVEPSGLLSRTKLYRFIDEK